MNKSIVLIFALFFLTDSFTQSVIHGTIKTADHSLLANALVSIFDSSNALLAQDKSSMKGAYMLLLSEQPDSCRLTVEYQGINLYDETISNWPGDTLHREIVLKLSQGVMQHPIVIKSKAEDLMSAQLSKIVINKNSIALSASFEDPSRVLYRYPGIVNTNDQANGIVFHGIPSDYTKWSIYNAEILNPNHLSTAGRFNDAPSLSSGGVLSIPHEAINALVFYSEPNTSNLPSALAGVMDLDFNTQANRYFKIGALGLEASFKDAKDKLYAHGRYSTVGLLTDLGVDFDGEAIKYQDLFVRYKANEKLEFINIVGSSSNVKEALAHIDASVSKDIKKIDYQSELFISGLRYKEAKANHSLFYSYKQEEKASINTLGADFSRLNKHLDNFNFRDHKIAQSSTFRIKDYSPNFYLYAGINSNYSRHRDWTNEEKNSSAFNYFETKPFIALNYFALKNPQRTSKINPILRLHYDNRTGQTQLEPAINLTNYFRQNQVELNLSYNSQLDLPLFISLYENDLSKSRTAALNAALSWKHTNARGSILYGRFFYHSIAKIYEEALLLEFQDGPFDSARLIDKKWKGIDLLYSSVLNELFYNLNFNLTHSSSIAYTSKFSLGKNFSLGNNTLRLMASGTHRRISNKEPYAFDYFRIDARIEYRFKKNRLTLDIQNLLGTKNTAYSYYDPLSNQMETQDQLGTIPVLSYKRYY